MIADNVYDILSAAHSDWPMTVGALPSTNANAIGLMDYDGYTSTEYFGSGSVFQPLLKAVVRNNSYEEGQEWCEAIKDALHRYHDDTFLSILLVGDIMYLGRGETKLHEFQLTFTIQERSE